MTLGLREYPVHWAVREHSEPLRRSVPAPLLRLRALILLSGGVRPIPLSVATARSMLDLPVDERHTFMQYWQSQALQLARYLQVDCVRMRVLLARHTLKPRRPPRLGDVSLRIERDAVEYRGIGGVLRDLASDYRRDDYILVANAAQLLLMPLPSLALELSNAGNGQAADVSLISHHEGTPGGLMLIRCGSLLSIPELGYVDMKEQALSSIAQDHRVRVVRPSQLTAIPVRTASDYLSAVRWRHRQMSEQETGCANNPFGEDWRPTFRIIEAGTSVDSSAHVHDSVVLRGGRVEAGAVLVRSLVGPGGAVRRGAAVCEAMISGGPTNRTWTTPPRYC